MLPLTRATLCLTGDVEATRLSETQRFTWTLLDCPRACSIPRSCMFLNFNWIRISPGATIWMFMWFDSPLHQNSKMPCIFSLVCLTCSYTSSCIFLIFLSIKKFITPKILIQITWNFFHDVPCNVYYFMMIFPEFVLSWNFKLPRVCSCVHFVHVLPNQLWNDDAISNDFEIFCA